MKKLVWHDLSERFVEVESYLKDKGGSMIKNSVDSFSDELDTSSLDDDEFNKLDYSIDSLDVNLKQMIDNLEISIKLSQDVFDLFEQTKFSKLEHKPLVDEIVSICDSLKICFSEYEQNQQVPSYDHKPILNNILSDLSSIKRIFFDIRNVFYQRQRTGKIINLLLERSSTSDNNTEISALEVDVAATALTGVIEAKLLEIEEELLDMML